ncbi:hypothetical protein MTR67_001198 [Solanum verrucosum]|uniref:Reverse transcriptase domain-containing protein n=1 Tax=Solanum verrucosum TaxID=315347 RepID=A0AAF0PMT5_SOLVR|nr:hypothetical protein MTR67_001198 [Solanum verrucosum]
MGSLACLGVSKQHLAKEIQALESKFMQLGILDKGGVLSSIEVRPTFIKEITTKQFEDENLNELRKKTVSGKAQDATLDAGGVLNFKGRIFFPRMDDLIEVAWGSPFYHLRSCYHFSIDMTPFEALYGRGCRSPIGWFEAGDVKPLVKDAQDKVRSIQAKLLAAQSRQKKYADHKKYHGDRDYIIKWDSVLLDKDLQYEEEPVAILDHDVRKLRTKDIEFVKFQ